MTDQQPIDQLAACPFCGGEARIEPKNWAGRDWIGVFCLECGLFHDSREPNDAEAIAAWNRRASPPGREGEAVAWRVRTSCGLGGFLTDAYPHNGAALVKSGYSVTPLFAHPPQGEADPAHCQKCGGDVEGWICQTCGQGFRENDAGALVFDPQGEAEMREKVAREIALELMRQDYNEPGEPFANGSGLTWSYIDQGEVDFGLIADRVLALTGRGKGDE